MSPRKDETSGRWRQCGGIAPQKGLEQDEPVQFIGTDKTFNSPGVQLTTSEINTARYFSSRTHRCLKVTSLWLCLQTKWQIPRLFVASSPAATAIHSMNACATSPNIWIRRRANVVWETNRNYWSHQAWSVQAKVQELLPPEIYIRCSILMATKKKIITLRMCALSLNRKILGDAILLVPMHCRRMGEA